MSSDYRLLLDGRQMRCQCSKPVSTARSAGLAQVWHCLNTHATLCAILVVKKKIATHSCTTYPIKRSKHFLECCTQETLLPASVRGHTTLGNSTVLAQDNAAPQAKNSAREGALLPMVCWARDRPALPLLPRAVTVHTRHEHSSHRQQRLLRAQ